MYLDEQRTRRLCAFVRGSQKLILAPDGRKEVYDLAADPLEQAPLSSEPLQRQLEEGLLGVAAHLGAPPGATSPAPIDADTRERLQKLGYVDGSPPR